MNSAAMNSSADSEWSHETGGCDDAPSGPDLPVNAPPEKSEPDDPPIEHPRVVGRYKIVKPLGKGGFGLVYLADDPDLHRRVAIKVPRWDRPLTTNAIERFLKEGKLLAQVDHPSIVAVHDLGTTEDGIPFVVMQYVDGRTLGKLLKSKKIPYDRMLRLLMQIAVALREAHKETIVHRDFKPSNVIIDDQGKIHLVDFGMALHDDLTLGDFRQRGVMGTPLYMAPEQIRGENHRIDGRTDIWAFGVTMYQMLTGRPPFRDKEAENLKHAICRINPRPLRQLNENIPAELERICLRCLSKLMDDRYQSMADLIDELRAATPVDGATLVGDLDSLTFSTQWSGLSKSDLTSGVNPSADIGRDSLRTTGESHSISAGSEPIQFVPKGLRAFDENDHDFFLRLLPGPTDRLGIPESIRFWSSRLGFSKQVEQIPVGVIYGPSGCGKSSFVRAGLIPRIALEAVPVYVDCTSPDLCTLINEKLFRALDKDAPTDELATSIRKIRQASDEDESRKIVIVLDQFEQWLEGCPDYAEAELTKALRQCDANSIQCLILVRDDYWMSISSFMRCLDQRVEEGKNAMSLPLFDQRHAKTVLQSYGRNVGALPASALLNRTQKRFVRDAIESISRNGTVLCVHLTILADMLANNDWGKTTFNKALGTDSIGSIFLERYLNDNVKVGKSGWLPLCEAIFSELLPPPNQTSLKAHERKKSELADKCGGNLNPEQLDNCLEYLARDLKLITEVESPDSSSESRYRLTHDFFVVPIQHWLNRRQSSTLSGRARSRFEQLCHQYQIGKSKRYLPNPLEYLMTLMFVRKQGNNSSTQEFLSASHRYYMTRTAGLIVLAILAVLLGTTFRNSQIATTTHAELFEGNSLDAVQIIETMHKNPELYISRLENSAASHDERKAIRSKAALAIISHNSPSRLSNLLQSVGTASENDYLLFARAIEECAELESKHQLIREVADASDDLNLRCRLATLQLETGHDDLVREILEETKNADGRTEFTDSLTGWHGKLDTYCDWLAECYSPNVVFGGVEALSFMASPNTNIVSRKKVRATIESLYKNAADPGVSTMIEFCARQWDVQLETRSDRDFFQFPIPGCSIPPGCLIRVEGSKFTRKTEDGNQEVVIQPFLVSSVEVTVEMFQQYVVTLAPDNQIRKRIESLDWWNDAAQRNKPARDLLESEVQGYLNWLSRHFEMPPTYESGKASDASFSEFTSTQERNGFRLPTADEAEWIARAGQENPLYSWCTAEYVEYCPQTKFDRIVQRYQSNSVRHEESQYLDVHRKAPNRLGIYECLGSVGEFCYFENLPQNTVELQFSRGSISTEPHNAVIGNYWPVPSFSLNNVGFRIVRTAE